MCPIVPTFTCGFVRSYFAFAMGLASDSFVLAGSGARRRLAGDRGPDLFGERRRHHFRAHRPLRGCRPPPLERLADALLDRRAVFLRDRAAADLVLALEPFPGVRLDLEIDVAVLAPAAGLAHVAPLRLGGVAEGLAVGDLGLADVGLHPELAQQAVHDDL